MMYLLSILGVTLSIMIPVLINMAFLTLLERKIMAFSQIRLGPNKVGLIGALQPFSDAMKLFIKQDTMIMVSMNKIYLLSPVLAISMSLLMCMFIPLAVGPALWEYVFMGVMMIFSLGVYPILLSGWSSNSKFSMIGSVRGVVQTVSYEISMALILLSSFIMLDVFSLQFSSVNYLVSPSWFIPCILVWSLVLLAELNRTPFDLSEAESELVSGFNTEYGSSKFALLFMAEYINIEVMSVLTLVIFFGLSALKSMILGILVMGGSVWIRTTLPRLRYDMLMSMSWKFLLPIALGSVIVSSSTLVW